jgi:hypothetical protein
MLSTDTRCDVSIPGLLQLKISPADLAQTLSLPGTTASTCSSPWRCSGIMGTKQCSPAWVTPTCSLGAQESCLPLSLYLSFMLCFLLFFFFFLNGASKGNEHPLLHFRLWSASNSKPSRLQTWWHQWKISSLASGDKLVSKCSRTQTVVPHYLRLCAHSVDGPSGFCV